MNRNPIHDFEIDKSAIQYVGHDLQRPECILAERDGTLWSADARGGVARTYYVGIESSMPAVPGMPPPLKALTVAPFGMEEGSAVELRGREFGLVVGEPAEFRFFQSAVRKNDAAGAMLEQVGDDLEELSPVEVTLPATGNAGEFLPVTLETVVTETGMLQLWSVARDGRRWKLEFNVREKVR